VDFRQAAANGSGDAASSVRKRVGFKRVRLVRQPLAGGYEGETFFFEVNSAPIFIKGAALLHAALCLSLSESFIKMITILDLSHRAAGHFMMPGAGCTNWPSRVKAL